LTAVLAVPDRVLSVLSAIGVHHYRLTPIIK
jgi:hypothetical protein